MRVKISFMDSIKGKTIELDLNLDETCPHCNGSGAESPLDVDTCPDCHGSGTIRSVQQTLFGAMQSQRACPRCNATGKIVKNKCKTCNGKGYVTNKKTFEVEIPAGISSGQQIRKRGFGQRGVNGGPNGDLYIEVVVEQSKDFVREGNDIHVSKEITYLQAILGDTIEVDTVYGPVEVTIPGGTQPGTILKLKEKGVKDLRTNVYGNEYLHIKVKIPTTLKKEQKELLEKLQEIETGKKTESKKKDSIFGFGKKK